MSQSVPEPGKGLNFFERYLTLWVVLCIAAGIALGKIAPGVAVFLDGLAIYVGEAPVVSIPIGICLFFMMYPIMVKIDFGEVLKAGGNIGPVFLTLFVNWAIKPFTMCAIAVFFLGSLLHSFIGPDCGGPCQDAVRAIFRGGLGNHCGRADPRCRSCRCSSSSACRQRIGLVKRHEVGVFGKRTTTPQRFPNAGQIHSIVHARGPFEDSTRKRCSRVTIAFMISSLQKTEVSRLLASWRAVRTSGVPCLPKKSAAFVRIVGSGSLNLRYPSAHPPSLLRILLR